MIYNKKQIYPGIWVYPNSFPKSLNLINRIEECVSNKETSWNGASVCLEEVDLTYRDAWDFKLSDLGKDHPLYKDIYNCQKDAAEDFCNMYSIKMDFWEWTNVVKYYPNQFFQEHADDGWSYKCAVSLVGYPNDDYTGGGLYFPKFNLHITPEIGDLVIFPSSFIYSHVALPVEAGVKYSFVTMLDYNDDAHTEEYDRMIDNKHKGKK
jgi:hypothetical protein